MRAQKRLFLQAKSLIKPTKTSAFLLLGVLRALKNYRAVNDPDLINIPLPYWSPSGLAASFILLSPWSPPRAARL